MFQKIEKSDKEEIVIRRSKGGKIFLWTVVFLVPLFFILALFLMKATAPDRFAFVLLLSVIPAGIAFWYTGPHEIAFNIKEKTFVARRGFPFLAKEFSGSLQEADRLCLRTLKNRYGHTVGYKIDLDWKPGKRNAFELIRSGNLEKARKLQQEFSSKLGIPRGEEI